MSLPVISTIDMQNRILVLFPTATFSGTNGGSSVTVRDNADGLGPFIDYWPVALGTQPTAEQLSAVTQNQLNALAISEMQTQAIALVNLLNDASANQIRAVALAIVQFLNNQYLGWISSFTSAVAAATSLANLQTRVAALTEPVTITRANAISAIITQIQNGNANGTT